jgi:two-component system sensor histidine kinase BaeS
MPRRALRPLRMLAAALVGSALIVVLVGTLSVTAQLVAAIAAAALVLCAAACLRIARRAGAAVDDSRAWAEVAQLRSMVLVLLRQVTSEREALKAKDELLAVVGHELRTPLSSIKGYGQLMARQLATVQEQVQRLDQLAGDVMDTARADGGRLTLQREVLSVAELVKSAAGRFRAANPARTVELELATCPPIEGDTGRLGQVLDNLLSNADKYSPAETVITLRAAEDGHWVRIAVIDRGAGIAPEHLPRLFERFYRVPGADKDTPAGFGLGLSIVHDLVDAHGGHVEVMSDGRGQGCTFTVVLPAPPLPA